MRILIWSYPFPPHVGGMERFAEDLACWLAERGEDVTVATATPADEIEMPIESVRLDSDYPFRVLRRLSSLRLMALVRWVEVVLISGLSGRVALAALLARRPAVIVHNLPQAVCPRGLAWHPRGPCTAIGDSGPCGVCLSGRTWVGTRPMLLRWRFQRNMVTHVAANVCASRDLADRLAVPHSQVIYNPLDTRHFRPIRNRSEPGLFLFVGRLREQKGCDVAIRALAKVRRERPAACLRVLGVGKPPDDLLTLVCKLGVEGAVEFAPAVDRKQMPERLAQAEVVVIPSLWPEPLPYAAAEALACGKAVIASDIGGLSELVRGRGWLVPPGDHLALAAAMLEAIADPSRRVAAGAAGRAFAEAELSMDIIGHRYLKLLNDVQ